MTNTGKPEVLFDVDGTLLDTNYLHVLAWTRALRSCGHGEVAMAEVHHAIGIDSAGLIHRLTAAGSEDAVGQELADAHTEEYQRLQQEIRPFPEAAELVQRCRDAGLTAVLATSAGADYLHWMLPAIGAGEAITGAVTADDVADGKPSPDLQGAAIEKFGLDPVRTVTVATPCGTSSRQAGPACPAWRSNRVGSPVRHWNRPAPSRSTVAR